MKKVLQLVGGKRVKAEGINKGKKGKQNQERKAKIEKAAIRLCCAYFEDLGYSVESVEKDNLGWDLEAVSGKTALRIEVKGLSASTFSVELTPNEYKSFSELSAAY